MVYEDRYESDIEKKAKKTIGKGISPDDIDSSMLITIDYKYSKNPGVVVYETDEFTSLCPFSELPDFGKITIRYIPDKKIVELKSLKYYLYSYRQVKIYMEEVVSKILEDLVKILKPLEMEVRGKFNVRGGISTEVRSHYCRKGRKSRLGG